MRRTPIGPDGDSTLVRTLGARLCERDLFRALDAPLVDALVRAGAVAELAPGEFLIREGEAATPEIYLLVDGALVVQSNGAFIARLDRPADVVGEVAVLMSSRRTADVVAESTVRALALPSRVLGQPEFAPVAAAIRQAMIRDDWAQYEVGAG